jgi:O-methyltransferase involved in polyketide biosynthesis
VGKTALGVARVRALESQREDRLFDDPYAQAFVDAAPPGSTTTT